MYLTCGGEEGGDVTGEEAMECIQRGIMERGYITYFDLAKPVW